MKTTNHTTRPATTHTGMNSGNIHNGMNSSSGGCVAQKVHPTSYGYIRVSTREQNEARQVDAMKKFGVDQMVIDKQSGKDFDRPAYQRLVGLLRATYASTDRC